ncbi:UdgX family uracil-DNA binding protein [Pontixanthobacter aestiaquae]|uniref:Type-4 uracil-DNA glycosylase n=1 Tax=Pontixanthobacter aestiaquae TaxID=1509367 RepID=A0A844Z3N0_9SPHN|nr:UdgX family uracil-DNA binding protein [Pontixanthobacter aestiaquae]MDN3646679.1 UdgX family uracil-DNA binding protein [Pontixanthobacter aestiaquae]MXO82338.1 UdgX family uracil-DNA binding protein [Pontixanthobacter aestiaquae]
MSALQSVSDQRHFSVTMPRADDFDFWRDQARRLVRCGIAPERVIWSEPGGSGDLFSASAPESEELPTPQDDAPQTRASKRFVSVAQNAILHSDPERFALLYRLLWRLQSHPRIMEDKADSDVRRIEDLAKSVRRDSHKMHAFVRFREVLHEDGAEHFVAWFEPDHHIVRANAGFFKRRFANMHWSILTPKGCIHWDGKTVRESPPAQRSDAPDGDPTEDLWRKYYASIFNPARLKVGAMMSEMPKKYWKNMPEAELIPELIAGAQSREAQMVDAGAMEHEARPETLEAMERAVQACRNCGIGELANQAVMGEGPRDAPLMIVGEQPGHQEDQTGRPFVGPAGQLLDLHLGQAGIARDRAYITNAVKHFKYVRRGKRRIHQTPTAKEVDTCRWWVEAEREVVKPKLILALGASAARAMLGKTVSINTVRGKPVMLNDGSELWITAHPSYLLRLDGDARAQQEQLFRNDLLAVRERLAELAD